MLWEVWLPFVRASVTRWQPRNCGPMVDFLESWAPILPIWILENILEQLIFPKLQREVRLPDRHTGRRTHTETDACIHCDRPTRTHTLRPRTDANTDTDPHTATPTTASLSLRWRAGTP